MAARASPPVEEEVLESVSRFGAEPEPGEEEISGAVARLAALPGLDGKAALALVLARAVSPSPSRIPEPLIARAAEALSPEEQVELVTWVSVQQTLHRLGCFQHIIPT